MPDVLKFALVEQTAPGVYVNRDQMGGLGIGTLPSHHLFDRLFGVIKRRAIRVPNLSLVEIAGCLRDNGHRCSVARGVHEIPPDVDAVVIPTSMVATHEECKFALRVRDAIPKARIIFSGIFSGLFPEKYLPFGDVVLAGEPESYFLGLKTADDVQCGLVASPRINDLDSLPFPDWSVFDLRRYRYRPIFTRYPMVSMLASRSCVYTCQYCPYPLSYGALRKRSVDHVIEELKDLKRRLGVRSVLFRDPLFTFNRKRSIEMMEKLIQADLRLDWVCETRFDHMDEDLILLAKRAGMVGVNVGVEAGNAQVLKEVRRTQPEFAQQKRLVEFMRQQRIWVTGFYILGHPTDTLETMEDTYRHARYLNTPVVQFTVNTPIPHAPEFGAMQEDLSSADWEDYTFFQPLLKSKTGLSHDAISRKLSGCLGGYYFRPSYFIGNAGYYLASLGRSR